MYAEPTKYTRSAGCSREFCIINTCIAPSTSGDYLSALAMHRCLEREGARRTKRGLPRHYYLVQVVLLLDDRSSSATVTMNFSVSATAV